MSTLTLNGRPSLKTGSSLLRSAVAGVAALAAIGFSTPSVWATVTTAQAQAEIQAQLPSGKNINSASAAQLAAAVATAITTSTDAAPAAFAAAAFAPVTVGSTAKIRSDRNSSAPLVVAKAISVISGTDTNFAAQIGALDDSVVVVNGTNTRENLTIAAKEAVVKTSLETLSDEAVATTGATITGTELNAAATQIGTSLATDTFLKTQPSLTLITTLQGGIAGIYGVKGRDIANAPAEAAAYVQGILNGGIPNSLTTPVFAVDILKDVNTNASVDELVTNKIAIADSFGDLPSVGSALIAAYSKEAVKITQGLVAAATAVNNTESNRVTVLTNLTALQPKSAASILEGSVYVDPYFAGDFTGAVFQSVVTGTPTTKTKAALATAATAAATGVGAILGSDGDVLTQVAQQFGNEIGLTNLPATKAATFASNLVKSALNSTVPTTAFSQFTGYPNGGGGGQFAGGKTSLATAITRTALNDLASVVDLFAAGVIQADGGSSITGSGLSKAESQVSLIAADIAKLAKNEAFVAGNATSVAGFLAGSLANTIADLSLPALSQSGLFAAVEKAVSAASAADKTDVAAQFTGSTYLGDLYNASGTGPIGTEETAVTNL